MFALHVVPSASNVYVQPDTFSLTTQSLTPNLLSQRFSIQHARTAQYCRAEARTSNFRETGTPFFHRFLQLFPGMKVSLSSRSRRVRETRRDVFAVEK
jgi:hypothetical protein